MKVEEAKKKVCPFMSGVVGNAVDVGSYEVNCICGDCMAWEYTKEYETKEYANHIDNSKREKYEFMMESDGWVFNNHFDQLWEKPLPEEKKNGFCKRLGQ